MISRITHPFPPLFDENSEILILGSFPSIKSREQNFFYGHPQNRFWKVISAIFDKDVPKTIEDKKILLHSCHIALWDVIAECDILGSSDSSIKNVKVNDISFIISNSKIKKIFANGNTAGKFFTKYILPEIGINAKILPSTSPANAAWNIDKLIEAWKIIL